MESVLAEVPYAQPKPLTKDQMLAQVRTVQEVMRTVMKDGEHYGIIPGCGNKPTLLKAGAEKLLHTFGFSTQLDVDNMFEDDEEKVGYRVTCRVLTRDGRLMGSGVGEASSEEEKWKWKEAVCEEQWQETLDHERRVKWKKGRDGVEKIMQLKTNPYDLSNTILKMAKKRALVDATLSVCACSDIFTQDIEEMGENGHGSGSVAGKRSGPTPTRQSAPGKGEKLGFGRCATATIDDLSEVDDENLCWYQDTLKASIKDKTKARFKESNTRKLVAVEAEIQNRADQQVYDDVPDAATAADLDAQAQAESEG